MTVMKKGGYRPNGPPLNWVPPSKRVPGVPRPSQPPPPATDASGSGAAGTDEKKKMAPKPEIPYADTIGYDTDAIDPGDSTQEIILKSFEEDEKPVKDRGKERKSFAPPPAAKRGSGSGKEE